MIATKPTQVTKVRTFAAGLDDQDPMYWALEDLLVAYDKYVLMEREIERVFGKGAAERLARVSQ